MKHSIRRHRILHRFTTRKYEQEASVTVHEGRQRKTPVDFQLWSQIGTLAFLTRERTCITLSATSSENRLEMCVRVNSQKPEIAMTLVTLCIRGFSIHSNSCFYLCRLIQLV